MKFLINTKIGLNRGKKRLWLEGVRLARCGFNVGANIAVDAAGDKLTIKRDANADKIVSKRKKREEYLPIIEITGSKLDAYNVDENVRVLITQKGIIVSRTTSDTAKKEMLSQLVNRVKEGKPLRVCSLFHGGGVLDSAIHDGMSNAGIKSKIALAVECESAYLDASLNNNPHLFDENSVVIESKVQYVNSNGSDRYDIGVMGIPCTGASIAGKSKNKLSAAEQHAEAGTMFHYALNFALKAPIVLIENVVEYEKTLSFSVIRSVLEEQGYKVQTKVVNGNEFGAFENRNRLCAVAMLQEIADLFDIDEIVPETNIQVPLLGELMDDVPEDSTRWKTFQYIIDKEVRDKMAGKGFGRTLLDENSKYCGVVGRLYHNCRSSEPYIKAKFDDVLTRLFTLNEHARIKTIPNRLINGVSDTIAHEILGQSVIFNAFVKVGEVIGEAISNFVNSSFTSFKYAA
ncbi:DNA cytosine methyltransferase [Photobacterium carnosum]|uniref:DNA cytosine methyltransferase n=1 Tax=Photobacterium carnosum TaxID=2023717 RepID=UPI001E4B7A79|nr:DNA cytosine methyltransferase [Photobacterium carnosum]MCD9553971.1 DNA cytosine methyltransferase [Photobacterium carnosum]